MRPLILCICSTLSLVPPLARAESVPLLLYVGEGRVLNESNIKRLAVGNGKIVSTDIIGATQLLLLGETQGQSTIHLWHRDGTENDYSVTVVSADTARLLSEVRALVGNDPKVSTRIVGDKIVVEGNDLGYEQSSRLQEIGKLYPQIVNLASRVQLDRMVEIDVRIMEFRKTALTQLGINWATTGVSGPTFGIVGDIHRGSAFTTPPNGSGLATVPAVPVGPRVAPFSTYFGISSSITSAIDASVTKGDATALSEPKLTCKSGGECKFLSGGEVPIPVSSLLGQETVQFKPYGVKLEVSPVVSDSGLIRLKAFTELSAIDPTVTVAGIPGFITRRTETEVNLQSEQTLVISGLFDGNDNRTLIKVPGLGDVPVLGQLFKSRDFQKKKSDLVIFLTPHIVSADSQSNLDAVKAGEEKRAEALRQSKLAE
jgi:pilus assembly protein CpaC